MSDKEYAIRPNKTQLKKEIKVLNLLGQELLKMPAGALKKVPMSQTMRDAIEQGRRLSKGALQRQLRRIASLMQQENVDAIRLELDRQKQPSKQQTAELHQLENWREQLLGGNERLLTDLIHMFPAIDRQRIKQLVRNSQQELRRNKPPKSSRLLFQYLSEIKRQSSSESANDDGENQNKISNLDSE